MATVESLQNKPQCEMSFQAPGRSEMNSRSTPPCPDISLNSNGNFLSAPQSVSSNFLETDLECKVTTRNMCGRRQGSARIVARARLRARLAHGAGSDRSVWSRPAEDQRRWRSSCGAQCRMTTRASFMRTCTLFMRCPSCLVDA
eukprot:COSAG02_NODE_17535_length_997_cov_1.378619_2_plen_144_part_00